MDIEKYLIADKWADVSLAKYRKIMSCGYLHYDENLIDILKAQLEHAYPFIRKEVAQEIRKELAYKDGIVDCKETQSYGLFSVKDWQNFWKKYEGE